MTAATNIGVSDARYDFVMSDDFEHWWTIAGKWVEEPNERRNGWSGMMRVPDATGLLYVKRQFNHLCRTPRHPFGWPTTSREWHYLHRLQGIGLTAPQPVFHRIRRVSGGTEAVLVTRELHGFASLDTQTTLTAAQRLLLAETLGVQLARLHRARLQHSCLYDKHVMIRWDRERPQVALIDLEKMRTRFTVKAAVRHDLEQLQRRQRIFADSEWQALLRSHRNALVS